MHTFTVCPECQEDMSGHPKCPHCWEIVEPDKLDARSPDLVYVPRWISPLDRRVNARLRQLLTNMREADLRRREEAA